MAVKDWLWGLLMVGGIVITMSTFIQEGAKLHSWPPVVFLSVLAACVTAVFVGGAWAYVKTFPK